MSEIFSKRRGSMTYRSPIKVFELYNIKVTKNMNKTALVLTGGGARAAYQAGALRAIGEISNNEWPFRIFTGTSAGAINLAYLAGQTTHFRCAAEKLNDMWRALEPDSVFRTDPASLSSISLQWLLSLSLGGLLRRTNCTYLLDTSPLDTFLKRIVDWETIKKNIQQAKVSGLAFTATNYNTGTAVSFFESSDSCSNWTRSTRKGVRTHLSHAHLKATSAIPLFFPPEKIGDYDYGDGAIRLQTPLSPAIHLGCDRILAIGVRYLPDPIATENPTRSTKKLSAADIAGVLMNAIFLDSLDTDSERMRRINETVKLIPEKTKNRSGLRTIPLLVLRPSQDLGQLARDQFYRFPPFLRYLLRGLGASQERGWDLLSYLAFHGSYTIPLMETGYKDALARRAEIFEFLGGH